MSKGKKNSSYKPGAPKAEPQKPPVNQIVLAALLLISVISNAVLGMNLNSANNKLKTLDSSNAAFISNLQTEVSELKMELNAATNTAPKPIVTIEMEDGQVMKLELFPDMAPNTVRSFIYLVNQGFYDGVVFHRIMPGFMIQGGDPTGIGTGGPGYSIRGEFPANGFTQNRLLHTRGTLSMARGGHSMDSAGSQFFIMHADTPFLDQAGYAAFGKVIEGIEVVDDIAMDPTTGPPNDLAISPRAMKKVTVETFGVDYGEPEKLPR